ncbi:unnamed protein product [Anthophora plagiata]
MTPIFVASVLLFALTCSFGAQVNRPDYIQCESNEDCPPGHCCTLGAVRYSIPQCKPMQEEGNVCRPGDPVTLNVTLGYPDNTEITIKGVHFLFCPCADGLTCDKKGGFCKETGEKSDTNRLIDENKKRDD